MGMNGMYPQAIIHSNGKSPINGGFDLQNQ